MSKQQYSFDEKCFDLAIYFYPAASAERLNQLAQQIQDVVESEDLDAPELETWADLGYINDGFCPFSFMPKGDACLLRYGHAGEHTATQPIGEFVRQTVDARRKERCQHGVSHLNHCNKCD